MDDAANKHIPLTASMCSERYSAILLCLCACICVCVSHKYIWAHGWMAYLQSDLFALIKCQFRKYVGEGERDRRTEQPQRNFYCPKLAQVATTPGGQMCPHPGKWSNLLSVRNSIHYCIFWLSSILACLDTLSHWPGLQNLINILHIYIISYEKNSLPN